MGNFDAEWYLKRNPDVAAAGVDPFKHFLEYGAKEGRAANVDDEPRTNWTTRFDAAWYALRYADVADSGEDPFEHFIKIGLREFRFPNRVEEALSEWSDRFDPEWYLERNPDVAEAGIDPLAHFVTQGILEHRRPNSDVDLVSCPITDAQVLHLRPPSLESEMALFVTHSEDGEIKPHVTVHLEQLMNNDVAVLLIVATDVSAINIPPSVSNRLNGIIVRTNSGYDFGAWAHVIQLYPKLLQTEILYFLNDSIFGPTNEIAFARLLRRIRASRADVVGLTESAERGWHLQSYFFALKKSVLRSATFRNFIQSIVAFSNKDDVVNEYETRLALTMKRAGFQCESMFPDLPAGNPTLYHWKRLLYSGFPFIKISTVRDFFQSSKRTIGAKS